MNSYWCEVCGLNITNFPQCQDCCEHWEQDHYICLDCGKELDPGEAIDKAMDSIQEER